MLLELLVFVQLFNFHLLSHICQLYGWTPNKLANQWESSHYYILRRHILICMRLNLLFRCLFIVICLPCTPFYSMLTDLGVPSISKATVRASSFASLMLFGMLLILLNFSTTLSTNARYRQACLNYNNFITHVYQK